MNHKKTQTKHKPKMKNILLKILKCGKGAVLFQNASVIRNIPDSRRLKRYHN